MRIASIFHSGYSLDREGYDDWGGWDHDYHHHWYGWRRRWHYYRSGYCD